MPTALIIGGGVAGPVTAMFLRCAGWDVEVFEAASAPHPYAGLFLNVATNGLSVLDRVGLRNKLLSDAHRCHTMVLLSGKGRVLGSVSNGPAGDLERGSVIVRRGWLHQVIREGARDAGIGITFGSRLVSIDEGADRVRAIFSDGQTAEGDVLIGADGIGSLTRRWIDPDAPAPAYRGLVGTGGFARVPGLEPTPDTQYFVFGARSFFGYLVRDDATVYWFANLTAPEPDRATLRELPPDVLRRQLKEVHADDPSPVPQILDNVQGEIGAYPIYDLVGVPNWSRGRVVAMGDAVHATSPSAGQGASLALEDAITLAKSLRDLPTHEAAFAQYQRLRQPRAEAVAQYARAIDAHKRVTRSRLGIAIRDRMMPLFLEKASEDTRNDWLYNYEIVWELTSDAETEASRRS